MKRLFFVYLWLCITFTVIPEMWSQTPLPAQIEVDTRLTKSNSPYIVSNTVTINKGATLQVDAGIVLIMGQGVSIYNNGRFLLNGAVDDYIRLETENEQRWRYIINNGSIFANYVSSKNGTRFISCNGDTMSIKNCVVSETTGTVGDDLISAHYTPYIEISGCDLKGDPSSSRIDAIDLDGVSNVLIEKNHISFFPDDAVDIGTGSTNVLIQNNTISNCDMGISVGESSKVFADYNLISYCGAGIQSHTSAIVTANHNTLYGNRIGVRALHYDSQPTSGGTINISNSIISNNTVSSYKVVENSNVSFHYCLNEAEQLPGNTNIVGNPGFVDAENGNFYLGPNSVAQDAGNGGNDLDETAPDLGFHIRFNAPLMLNEISSANLSHYADEVNEYDDWFELLNTSGSPINLLGYYVSDNPDDPLKYQIDASLVIQPQSAMVFWADDSLAQGNTHVSFGLKGRGEFLSLSNSTGELLDSVTFPVVPINHTYGRDFQTRSWAFFKEPTPGNKNNVEAYPGMAGKVNFSNNGGGVASVSLNISAQKVNETITYSTDGTDPVIGSEFQENITVNATSTVRAVAVKNSWLPGFPQSRLFYSPGSSGIPVLSLSMNENDLYGNKGIYTNYTNSSIFWERPVSLSYYNPFFQWSANAGIRIQGGNSVYMPKKAFRLFFRAGYGNDKLIHSPFQSGPLEFDKLVLRSGYDDDITITSGTLLRDPLSAEIWKKLGEMATESDFVALYLNNKHWGIYNVRESIDENFVMARLNTEDFDLIRFLKTGSEIKYGTNDEWNVLMDYFQQTDFTNPDVYEEVSTIMDMNSILNLLAFVHCTAFRSWTWGTFGIKPDNGKWTWTIWDTDRGYSLTTWNGFTEYANTSAEKWSNIIPQKLIQNQTFQHALINRNCDLLNTLFIPGSSIALMDSLVAVIEPEIENEYAKWNPGNAHGWPGKLEKVRTFLKERPEVLYDQMMGYFSLEDTSHIRIRIEGNGQVQLNSILVKESSFKGTYMKGVPIELQAMPQKGAEFVGWKGISNEDLLKVNPENYTEITAVFKDATTTETESIVITEIMYHPMDKDGGEWIELYNPNNFTIDLSNWRFTDLGTSNQFNFAENTQILPKNYLIVAGELNEFSVRFPEITNTIGGFNNGPTGFNLNNSGETIYLYNASGKEEDRVSYMDVFPWPEAADGRGPSLQLNDNSADNLLASNWGTYHNPLYTPGDDNRVVHAALEDVTTALNVSVYPNPISSDNINIELQYNKKVQVKFVLYDITGKVMKSHQVTYAENGKHSFNWKVGNLKAGSYLLQTSIVDLDENTQGRQTIVIVE